MNEEQTNLFRLLDSNDIDNVTLGLQIATNGEKQNLEVLLYYFESKFKKHFNYKNSYEFIDIAKVIINFSHCNNLLDYNTCKKISNLLNFNCVEKYINIYNKNIIRKLKYFFKVKATKKGLSYYLSK